MPVGAWAPGTIPQKLLHEAAKTSAQRHGVHYSPNAWRMIAVPWGPPSSKDVVAVFVEHRECVCRHGLG